MKRSEWITRYPLRFPKTDKAIDVAYLVVVLIETKSKCIIVILFQYSVVPQCLESVSET